MNIFFVIIIKTNIYNMYTINTVSNIYKKRYIDRIAWLEGQLKLLQILLFLLQFIYLFMINSLSGPFKLGVLNNKHICKHWLVMYVLMYDQTVLQSNIKIIFFLNFNTFSRKNTCFISYSSRHTGDIFGR